MASPDRRGFYGGRLEPLPPEIVSAQTEQRPIVLVLSGPAGAGKTTLAARLTAECPQVQRVITATTRNPREGEVDGRDYHFLTVEDFVRRIAHSGFYEYARVHDRYYGVLKTEIDAKLAAGADPLLVIDVQGAATLREVGKNDPHLQGRVYTVFIEPESLDQLAERLRQRGSDDPAEIARRIESAKTEIARATEFDARITTTTKDADFAAVKALYDRWRKAA